MWLELSYRRGGVRLRGLLLLDMIISERMLNTEVCWVMLAQDALDL